MTQGVFLGANIDQVRKGVIKSEAEKNTTSEYGHVVSMGEGTLVLEVSRADGNRQRPSLRD